MASTELQAVLEMLESGGVLAGDTIDEQRTNMEAATTVMPLPDDVRFEAVDAGGVPAEWTVAPGAGEDRVIVYFHGGGYCIGSVRTHRLLVAGLSRVTGARVLSVDYRLAPEHPHPAALEDAVAAYRHVVSLGLAPQRVALAGDSCGGGLVVATLLALRDAGDPLPAAGVCISPWFDLALSGETVQSKAAADPICSEEMLRRMAEAYLDGRDPETPLASPLYAPLAGLPPLLVQVGTAEILLDDSRRFAERARAAGVSVDLEPWDDMVHVWHAFAMLLPEGQQAIDRIGRYLEARFAKAAA